MTAGGPTPRGFGHFPRPLRLAAAGGPSATPTDTSSRTRFAGPRARSSNKPPSVVVRSSGGNKKTAAPEGTAVFLLRQQGSNLRPIGYVYPLSFLKERTISSPYHLRGLGAGRCPRDYSYRHPLVSAPSFRLLWFAINIGRLGSGLPYPCGFRLP